MSRRHYLDWLRGVAVLIMVEAHTFDSWTRIDDRKSGPYLNAIIVGGFGAPIFLFLAGVALALAVGARTRTGKSDREAATLARRRGWQIFGLAFLFRFQSWVISGGAPASLLKVDILNIMGVAMLMAAGLWSVGRDRWSRASMMAVTALAIAMLTPIVRTTPLLSPLPDPIEWYLRPAAGRTTFTLFPWAGFLLAGAAIGVWLDATRTERDERRAIVAFAVLGPVMALAGYLTSLLPPIYAQTSFWTTSPTFFFLRLGILIAAIPVAYGWLSVVRRSPLRAANSPLQEFGIASLFVYWIHVEMVYGIVSMPIHRALTFNQALAAYVVFIVFLFALVKLKDRATKYTKTSKDRKAFTAAEA